MAGRSRRGLLEQIAAAMAEEIDRPLDHRSVATDGAHRAAGLIAELM